MTEATPRAKKLCVVAGNYQQAQNYASQARLHPNDWFYPNDVHRMRGLRNYAYIRIGEWGRNPNIHDIDVQLSIGNAKEVTCAMTDKTTPTELKAERHLQTPHAWIMNIPRMKICLFCGYTCPTSQHKVPECVREEKKNA